MNKQLADEMERVKGGGLDPMSITLSVSPKVGDIGCIEDARLVASTGKDAVIQLVKESFDVVVRPGQTQGSKKRVETGFAYLEGAPIDDVADGQPIPLKGVYEVIGVKQFGPDRLLHIRKFDVDQWLDALNPPQQSGNEATPRAKKSTVDPQKAAASKLQIAKQLADKGKKPDAIKRLHSLIEEFPDTDAAKEAGELLGRLE